MLFLKPFAALFVLAGATVYALPAFSDFTPRSDLVFNKRVITKEATAEFFESGLGYCWAEELDTKKANYRVYHTIYPAWEQSLKERPLPKLTDYKKFVEDYTVQDKTHPRENTASTIRPGSRAMKEATLEHAGLHPSDKFRHLEICSTKSEDTQKPCYSFYIAVDGHTMITDYMFKNYDKKKLEGSNDYRMNSGQIAGYTFVWMLLHPNGEPVNAQPTHEHFAKLGDVRQFISINIKEDAWENTLRDYANNNEGQKGVTSSLKPQWTTFHNREEKAPGDLNAPLETQGFFVLMGSNNGGAHSAFIQATQGIKRRMIDEFIVHAKFEIMITKYKEHPGLSAPPPVPPKPKHLQHPKRSGIHNGAHNAAGGTIAARACPLHKKSTKKGTKQHKKQPAKHRKQPSKHRKGHSGH